MPRRVNNNTREVLDRALRQLAGNGYITGRLVEDKLVEYFSTNRRKALLERVHTRVCNRRRRLLRRAAVHNHVQQVHTPNRLLQLILDMGATKSSYRCLVAFWPACNCCTSSF